MGGMDEQTSIPDELYVEESQPVKICPRCGGEIPDGHDGRPPLIACRACAKLAGTSKDRNIL